MRVGILAVQGAFIEHTRMLTELGCECVELRQKSDIVSLDGLVLPGGESTVQGKLLKELDMFYSLREIILSDTPVLATCAGLILLAENISNDERSYFGTMPITVKRNAYGRQLGSFRITAPIKGIGDFGMTFIRAPYIEAAGADVDILATVDNHIVAARYKNQLGLAFHPELDNDNRIHKLFTQMSLNTDVLA